MKLKEKLANEFYAKCDYDEEEIIDAYIAGFEKAREMAFNSLRDFDVTYKAYDIIGNLGEEKVE